MFKFWKRSSWKQTRGILWTCVGQLRQKTSTMRNAWFRRSFQKYFHQYECISLYSFHLWHFLAKQVIDTWYTISPTIRYKLYWTLYLTMRLCHEYEVFGNHHISPFNFSHCSCVHKQHIPKSRSLTLNPDTEINCPVSLAVIVSNQ